MRHYIYQTVNLINNKTYIGIHSIDGEFGSDGYIGSGVAIKRAIAKYGKDAFSCELLFEAASRQTVEDLEELFVDIEFANSRNTYNLMTGGGSSGLPSTETKMRMSKPKTIEHRKKISISKIGNQAFKGRTHSDETKAKMSAASKGKKKSLEHCASLSAAHKGKTQSAETRAKRSATVKGVKKAKITCPHCGKVGGDNTMHRWHFDNCKFK